MERPFSQACENNQSPILSVISRHFVEVDFVLEIGSGTGQHAVYFAKHLPQLLWQPSDRQPYLEGINQWLSWAALDNINSPLELDVNKTWPIESTPAIFSANTLHIMSWQEVEGFFSAIKTVLCCPGIVCFYGPFNKNGQYTSDSNAQFDQWLKARNPLSGIRDFEAIDRLAKGAGLRLLEDCALPANNRCLVYQQRNC